MLPKLGSNVLEQGRVEQFRCWLVYAGGARTKDKLYNRALQYNDPVAGNSGYLPGPFPHFLCSASLNLQDWNDSAVLNNVNSLGRFKRPSEITVMLALLCRRDPVDAMFSRRRLLLSLTGYWAKSCAPCSLQKITLLTN